MYDDDDDDKGCRWNELSLFLNVPGCLCGNLLFCYMVFSYFQLCCMILLYLQVCCCMVRRALARPCWLERALHRPSRHSWSLPVLSLYRCSSVMVQNWSVMRSRWPRRRTPRLSLLMNSMPSVIQPCFVVVAVAPVITLLLTTHKAACAIILVLSVCLYVNVHLSDSNFWKPWRRKFILEHAVYLHGLLVKFVYEGHRVKVTGAKKVENSYSHNATLQLTITPVVSNIEPWCLCAVWGFRIWPMEWCNRCLCHVTRSDPV